MSPKLGLRTETGGDKHKVDGQGPGYYLVYTEETEAEFK